MSSFLPVLPNESFTFNYNDKRGVDLEFKPRKEEKKEQEWKSNTASIGLKGEKDNYFCSSAFVSIPFIVAIKAVIAV